MMSRFWVGVGLLAAFLALGIGSAAALQAVHQPIAQSLETAAEHSLAGDLQSGAELAGEAEESWNRYWRGTASVASHGPMEEIDSLFAQLPAYAREQHRADFAACCFRLASLIRAVADAQSFQWWNLL